MSLTVRKTNPISLFDEAIQNFFSPSNLNTDFLRRGIDDLFPAMDLLDRENELVLKAELPGVSKDDVDISVQNNILTISGKKNKEHKEEKDQYVWVERSYGEFSRSIRLPDHTDHQNIQASYQNGVLELIIPKKEEAQPKKIDIKLK